MEPNDYQIIRNFISQEEVNSILSWIEIIEHNDIQANHHLTKIAKSLNGKSYIFDISKTKLTKYITQFQSISNASSDCIPEFIQNIIVRVSNQFNLPLENVFLQAVDMKKGGKIDPHYDAALDGYINYKCNISVVSENYNFYIDKNILSINPTDIYCFEASLFKHWTEPFNTRRVFLSIGFIIPYSLVGRTESDPRVRLSKRIEKYFQN
jgi:hypothetical protein